MEIANHPTPFNEKVLDAIAPHIQGDWTILDPFAGIGRFHRLSAKLTIGVELEPEWALAHPRTIKGDALELIYYFGLETFDAIVTSPSFGNRFADHHNAQDNSKRHTYKHYLGRDLSENNSGVMQWGPDYKYFHYLALDQMYEVLKERGKLFLNIKDHVRGGKRMYVSKWWKEAIELTGFHVEQILKIPVRSMRHGENYHLRVATENVIVASK